MPTRDPEKFRTAIAIAIILAGAITALLTKKKTRQTLWTMFAGWAAGVLTYMICFYSDYSEVTTLISVIVMTGSVATIWPKLPTFADGLIEIYQKSKNQNNDSL